MPGCAEGHVEVRMYTGRRVKVHPISRVVFGVGLREFHAARQLHEEEITVILVKSHITYLSTLLVVPSQRDLRFELEDDLPASAFFLFASIFARAAINAASSGSSSPSGSSNIGGGLGPFLPPFLLPPA